jgi:ATP-dependent 26S proteasome regulatory subunit
MQIKPIEVKGRNLEEILLPFECIEAINLFIQTLRHFDHIHRPLRFLLNGKPGTGKTETVRSIIEACKGYATFLLVEGRCELREVFELASFFTPAVVCLDDIDLSFGNRLQSVDRHRLGDFLNLMDGFNKNNIFVLATTNDKDWVDVAASRPGRFDMILDVNLLEPSLYLELIRQRCPNEEIIRLFDDSILEEMKEKKVSGAFVVNLIKHIEIKHALNHVTLDSGHVRDAIEKMYRGFYKRVNEGEVIGFAAN